jgi:hypothetical protein
MPEELVPLVLIAAEVDGPIELVADRSARPYSSTTSA